MCVCFFSLLRPLLTIQVSGWGCGISSIRCRLYNRRNKLTQGKHKSCPNHKSSHLRICLVSPKNTCFDKVMKTHVVPEKEEKIAKSEWFSFLFIWEWIAIIAFIWCFPVLSQFDLHILKIRSRIVMQHKMYIHGVWKPQKKSHSTLRAKRATFTFWVIFKQCEGSRREYYWYFFFSVSFKTHPAFNICLVSSRKLNF